MLVRYVAHGERRYGREPIPVYRRSVWEIQIVLGGARPVFGIGEGGRGRTVGDSADRREGALYLWVFRPESVHGWTDSPDGRSTIAVVHVESVPDELRLAMGDGMWLGVALSPTAGEVRPPRAAANGDADDGRGTPDGVADGPGKPSSSAVAYLMRAVDRLSPHGLPASGSAARSAGGGDSVARLRTTAWVYAATAEVVAATDSSDPGSRREDLLTERVIAWYEANMHRDCTLDEIARAVATSESTIGRAFHRVHHCSTREALLTRRMERAGWMIRNRRESFLEIAEACGYRDQSSFSRAVRRYFGASPRTIRGSSSTR
jgi:AraC-like DNA-binding protein